jgi:hypothetical protein
MHAAANSALQHFMLLCRFGPRAGLAIPRQTFVRPIAAAGGSRMSNGTASALNSEQDLASIPMAQGGLSRLAIALPVAPLCSACGPGMVKKLKL